MGADVLDSLDLVEQLGTSFPCEMALRKTPGWQ